MAKRLEFKNEAKAKMQKGVTLLSNVVKATMGPCGRSVLIVRKNRALHTTKDGATVAEAVKLEESFANMGASIVKEAAFKMRQKRGDGTT
ncbi:MAG: chaperonin GroEL, partial [Verrucomicrobia bacterium]|nr:chaperonin GroEL [Verrucomicrobiota bacterium]